ncbi:hypothetical protein AB1Y20_013710 [Prymnesium parvum]|uniref:VOC domain-containing protein n=1 Tax=Prymnesium parvum TaxID=97485 RepID=A0AB34IJF8_PRYPA|mmetsp:Transcript_25701/g.58829  ORF Transcript_25701/g.58829 Transcript_25701/m.58829 type:complete len:246 (-) Transcript_25701:36-773(-)
MLPRPLARLPRRLLASRQRSLPIPLPPWGTVWGGCSSLATSAAALEHSRLCEELESVRQQLRKLEASHPELVARRSQIEGAMHELKTVNPDLRSPHNVNDGFSPPKLHHINVVSREVRELLHFYRDIMKMDEMPIEMFPRNAQTAAGAGSDVPINFTTDGHMQMHLATQDLGVAFRSGHVINPIGVGPIGHIAFRTSDIESFKKHLDCHGVAYSDYGTRFARDWHQIFFHDPEGTIVEVHEVISS